MRIAGFAILILLPIPAMAQNQAPLQAEINRAVDHGVEYLKKGFSKEEGHYAVASPKGGMTALVAWTLLESGLSREDPLIQKAARFLRQDCLDWDRTYAVTLGILFFDKLGDPADVPLIESLTVRVLGGQNSFGTWDYYTTLLEESEKARLMKVIQASETDKGKRKKVAAKGKRQLSPEIVLQLRSLRPRDSGNFGDNSNNHFAMLALWVGRRHGMPVDSALARLGKRLRDTQHESGGWGYDHRQPGNPEAENTRVKPAMTCIGLIGLGLELGAASNTKDADLNKDVAVKRGLELISHTVGHPAGNVDKAHRFEDAGENYYFLWALERMAVLYNLKTIGEKDWYRWGAEILVRNQNTDGNWANGKYAYGPDACFALLFLKKVNVTADLKIEIKDPGKVKAPEKLVFALPIPLQKDNQTSKDPGPEPKKIPEPIKKDLPKVDPKTPEPGPDARLEAGRLIAALGKEPASKHDAIFEKILKGQGAIYTQELASAIPDLPVPTQAKARVTLAQRLSQLPAAGLRKEMKALDVEIRRAAALAAGQANKPKDHIPDLIDLLEDPETPVVQAAHQALKQLTSQDFGPQADATRTEIRQAAAEWRAWWKKQQK